VIPDWPIYLITDRHQVGAHGFLPTIDSALQAGIRAVQLREKDLVPPALLALARDVRALTARAGARLIINGRLDVMFAVDADGVHLRSESVPTHTVRRVIGPNKFLGVSTHSMEEAQRAADEGADFVTFGPVYDTPSKIRYGRPVGLAALAAVCRRVRVPVYALGGISRANIPEVLGAGAYGVAMISEIMSSRDVRRAALECVEALRVATRDGSVDHR
jgi:thiamine-phosphate pyrophosphorylase